MARQRKKSYQTVVKKPVVMAAGLRPAQNLFELIKAAEVSTYTAMKSDQATG